jgi:MFS transporter, PAT family, beta-lactamase induction signal transducer AmpG
VNGSLLKHTNPIVFLFLRLPFGISMGFVTVTLPFWLSEAGVSVTQIGFIEVVALSPITGRVLLALVVDLTWSPRTWFAVGALVTLGSVAAGVKWPLSRKLEPQRERLLLAEAV